MYVSMQLLSYSKDNNHLKAQPNDFGSLCTSLNILLTNKKVDFVPAEKKQNSILEIT